MLINLRPLLECQGKVYYYEDPPVHRCDVWFSRSTSSVLCRSAARSDHSDECLAVLPPHMQPGVVEEEGVRRVEPPCHPLGEHLAPHRRTLDGGTLRHRLCTRLARGLARHGGPEGGGGGGARGGGRGGAGRGGVGGGAVAGDAYRDGVVQRHELSRSPRREGVHHEQRLPW